MPHRSDTQPFIVARKKREEFMEHFTGAQQMDERQRMMVNWETKGDRRMARKDLHRHLDQIQAKHGDALVERRRRLADLLLREREEHDQLLSNLAETDEQRRDRIIRKAKELRAKREAEKRADNVARNDRAFREKIDCLRQAESRLKVMQVADQRFEQLALAQRRRDEDAQEEIYFAQQAAEAVRLANERAQSDLEQRYIRQQRLTTDLAAQVEGNKMREAIAEEERRQENEEFKQLLHEDQVQEAQKQAARRAAQQQLAEEMKSLNEELERARKEEYEKLRKEDRELLDSILAEIAETQRKEREEKRAKVERRHAEWVELQQSRSQKKDDDSALDKLWEEANEKEWRKREACWKADRDKREALLRNILIVRRQQVLDKRQQERDDAETRKREHAEFLANLARDSGSEAAAQQKHAAQVKETQQYLDWQIGQRRAEKEQERLDRSRELSAQGALEKEYEDRIRQEMANLERAKPERYRDVPLLPAHQRNRGF